MSAPTRLGERESRLFCRFAATRCPELRAQLVERHLPLARYSANQYARGPEPFDDLLQIACIGLLKAIDRFDPERGVAFSSYALPTMSGELRRHFRDRGWSVRPPRGLQEQALLVERAAAELLSVRGHGPTVDEIAERTGLETEEVLEGREALSAHRAVSFSTPSGDEDGARAIGDRLGALDDGFEAAERRAMIGRLSRVLTAREREIVRLRFEEDLTQSQIGKRVGVSQMHVSRLLRATVDKLRSEAHPT
ncbi:MAG: sigma-70 family polymerase sigma factor [Ilumatobacteraceae bacterium]|nr:sigma-70 family polymerase sigma factor [Ilumatobacteraceae bacterium]